MFPKKPKRDFVYIKDVVSATLYPLTNVVPSGVYEVGSGEARTFEDVLDLLGIKYTYWGEEKIPKWYQYYTQAEKSKMLKGWKANFQLEEGLAEYELYLNKTNQS